MTPPSLPAGLEATAITPLASGSICEVWRADLADGRTVVVKATPYPAEVEADGLRALVAAGAPAPGVVAAEGHVLVIDHLVAEHPPRDADWARLGRALAALHAVTAPTFGWRRDNRIGSLPQDNAPEQFAHADGDDWPTFYARRRIRPHLDAPALPREVRRRIEAALDGPLHALLDHDPPASLTHGDLWSGNVLHGRWLIDPAVCHADREHELAFMEVFGGFPAAVWDAYQEAWPLPDGWARRRPALALYHLLVHVRLFGAGYVGAVTARLDELGW